MAKIQDELNNLKAKNESSSMKFAEVSEKELAQVAGGGPTCSYECRHGTSFAPLNGDTVGASMASCTICIHWQRPEGPCELD